MKRLNSSQSSLVLVVIHKSGSSNLTILEVIMILVAQFANVGKFWKGFYHVASFKCQSWLQTIIMKKFNNSVVNSIQFWLVHDLVSLWLDIIECWWIIVTHNLKFFMLLIHHHSSNETTDSSQFSQVLVDIQTCGSSNLTIFKLIRI